MNDLLTDTLKEFINFLVVVGSIVVGRYEQIRRKGAVSRISRWEKIYLAPLGLVVLVSVFLMLFLALVIHFSLQALVTIATPILALALFLWELLLRLFSRHKSS